MTASRILVIAAHPDDIDFGAAGSVAAWTSAGAEVAYCVVTDGDAGGFDDGVPREDMPGLRRAEQTAAAAAVGVSEVAFLGYPDGRLEVSMDLRRDLARVIRQVKPDRVVCQSPERNYDRIFASHPDHLAAGEATLCAVYPDARNPYTFPELLAGGFGRHVVSEVWMMGTPNPNVWVDVTATFDKKLAALRAHVSQETDRDGRLEEWMRGWLTEQARAGGLPDGTLAEGFRRMDTSE
ncbi:MAG TPA: PIG-L deacetylase family protein [Acidimicrobiales bacterium]|nr:PIG-L deacetylase family protein [Acidimicrobiales bacterium]